MADTDVHQGVHPFPWHLGVFDAHCHPTDTVVSLEKISSMKTKALTIMATRRQDQHLVFDFAEQLGLVDDAERDRFLVPAFGWHPWFSYQIVDDLGSPLGGRPTRDAHYKQVIVPSPEDKEFLASLPEPRSLSQILQESRAYLQQFPLALVGEIGLDRTFRIPQTGNLDAKHGSDPALTSGGRGGRRLSQYRVDMDHQRSVLTAQLRLAGELQRAVSIHGVAAHGVVYETIAATWRGHEKKISSKRERKKAIQINPAGDEESDAFIASQAKPYPPRICLHSYSGGADTLKHYLQPSIPATVFFSFSTLVNFSSPSRKATDAIKAVPDDRILAESDLHAAGERMDELMEDVIRRICQIKGWSLESGVKQLASNWRHFIFNSI